MFRREQVVKRHRHSMPIDTPELKQLSLQILQSEFAR
jgi:hypothetical protein